MPNQLGNIFKNKTCFTVKSTTVNILRFDRHGNLCGNYKKFGLQVLQDFEDLFVMPEQPLIFERTDPTNSQLVTRVTCDGFSKIRFHAELKDIKKDTQLTLEAKKDGRCQCCDPFFVSIIENPTDQMEETNPNVPERTQEAELETANEAAPTQITPVFVRPNGNRRESFSLLVQFNENEENIPHHQVLPNMPNIPNVAVSAATTHEPEIVQQIVLSLEAQINRRLSSHVQFLMSQFQNIVMTSCDEIAHKTVEPSIRRASLGLRNQIVGLTVQPISSTRNDSEFIDEESQVNRQKEIINTLLKENEGYQTAIYNKDLEIEKKDEEIEKKDEAIGKKDEEIEKLNAEIAIIQEERDYLRIKYESSKMCLQNVATLIEIENRGNHPQGENRNENELNQDDDTEIEDE